MIPQSVHEMPKLNSDSGCAILAVTHDHTKENCMSTETKTRLIHYTIASLAIINLIALFVFNYGLKDPSFEDTDYHSYLGEETGIQDDRGEESEEEQEESEDAEDSSGESGVSVESSGQS